jgi:hypothetical protein
MKEEIEMLDGLKEMRDALVEGRDIMNKRIEILLQKNHKQLHRQYELLMGKKYGVRVGMVMEVNGRHYRITRMQSAGDYRLDRPPQLTGVLKRLDGRWSDREHDLGYLKTV